MVVTPDAILAVLFRLCADVTAKVKRCGYGLVVERVLAKDETGVRFSLPAQLRTATPYFLGITLWMCV